METVSSPEDDPRFVKIIDELAVAWATLEIEEDGYELALQFARTAYDCGARTMRRQLAAA